MSEFRITIVTLFPGAFESFLSTSLLGKARAEGLVRVDFVSPRDFTEDRHRTVDAAPYGGGPGMLLKPEPVVRAVESVSTPDSWRLLLTPAAPRFTQERAHKLAEKKHLVLVCGRYEGVDERILPTCIDESLSIGDYVLSGGEVAAMTVIEAVTRLLPGVLGDAESAALDSFSGGLLEHPQYTRPSEFRGMAVPEVLQGGNHQQIETWRRTQGFRRTAEHRPDLLQSNTDSDNPLTALANRTHVVLAHHPVLDREGEVVTTSVTNLDLHDIARSANTYGLAGYTVVSPIAAQREMVDRIVGKWRDHGAKEGRDGRAKALDPVCTVASVQEALAAIAEMGEPFVLATAADPSRAPQLQQISAAEVQSLSVVHDGPLVILLGTGWGLADEVFQLANRILTPVRGRGEANHLSVRSAFAVLLDRLFGQRG